MKASILFPVLLLVLLANCSAQINQAEMPKSSYYEQVVSLLDPSNTVPLISGKSFPEGHTREVGDVKVGMTMAEVVSVWGKPKAFGLVGVHWLNNEMKNTGLRYGDFTLNFNLGKLQFIRVDGNSTFSNQVVASKTNHVPALFADNYCEMLRNIFKTNTSEHTPDFFITNSVISLPKLKDGEIGLLKLGMPMSEVVTVLGKPNRLDRFSTKQATLAYDNCKLSFSGESLSSITFDMQDFGNGIKFSNTLTAQSRMADFLQACGVPKRLYPHECGYMLLSYENNRKILLFTFGMERELLDNEDAQKKANICNVSLHYYGIREMWADSETLFIDTVAKALEINSNRIQNLRWEYHLSDIIPILEKELGKPLTEDQRKKVVSAFEMEEQAMKTMRTEAELNSRD